MNTETLLKRLDDISHTSESEWAATLSNVELADELIANLWAEISFCERKKAAVLETAIDRLRAMTNTHVAEHQTLVRCDEMLEATQTYLRGACKVKPIRELIAKRLNELTNP